MSDDAKPVVLVLLDDEVGLLVDNTKVVEVLDKDGLGTEDKSLDIVGVKKGVNWVVETVAPVLEL